MIKAFQTNHKNSPCFLVSFYISLEKHRSAKGNGIWIENCRVNEVDFFVYCYQKYCGR